MDKDEIIEQLLAKIDLLKQENDQLRRENELLRGRIAELESRLARYENAHTPPSLRRGGNRKKDQKEGDKGKPGQKKGHKGLTRQTAKPDRQIEVTRDLCPDCGSKLGSPFKIESKIIEEIPYHDTIGGGDIKRFRCAPQCFGSWFYRWGVPAEK